MIAASVVSIGSILLTLETPRFTSDKTGDSAVLQHSHALPINQLVLPEPDVSPHHNEKANGGWAQGLRDDGSRNPGVAGLDFFLVTIPNAIQDGPYGYDPEVGLETQVVSHKTEIICDEYPHQNCSNNANYYSSEPHEVAQGRCIEPCEDNGHSRESITRVTLEFDPLADFSQGDFGGGSIERVNIRQPIYEGGS